MVALELVDRVEQVGDCFRRRAVRGSHVIPHPRARPDDLAVRVDEPYRYRDGLRTLRRSFEHCVGLVSLLGDGEPLARAEGVYERFADARARGAVAERVDV